ncbi:MAG: DUF6781 family protein [Phycisphaerae bacterium]|nr:DUF6781 family protein [Phycisphaerae bacterium]
MAKNPASKKSPNKQGATRRNATAVRAARIVEERVDVRRRMHDLVSDAISTGEIAAVDVRRAIGDALTGVRAGLAKAVPADHDNILHQTFDGMSDAVAASARSARRAVDEAKQAGRRFTNSDLKEFTGSMKSIEKDFLAAVSDAAHSMSDESSTYLQQLVRRAKSAGSKLGPAARESVRSASKNAPELAREAVKAGGRAAAGVASEFALGVSGVFSGIGSALRGSSTPTRTTTSRAPSATNTKKKKKKKSSAKAGTRSKAKAGQQTTSPLRKKAKVTKRTRSAGKTRRAGA